MQTLKQKYYNEISDLLKLIETPKIIILNSLVANSLNFIIDVDFFRNNNIEYILDINSNMQMLEQKYNIIYFTYPILKNMKIISEKINSDPINTYYLCFVPCSTTICMYILKEMDVLDKIIIKEFHLGLIPIDEDVLSLELDFVFSECYYENNTSSLKYIADSIFQLGINNITPHGQMAKSVYKMLTNTTCDNILGIKNIILVDRTEDLITPMITEYTYESFVEEILKINNQGNIFEEIRYLRYTNACLYIKNEIRELKTILDNVPDNIHELKIYTGNLGKHLNTKKLLEEQFKIIEQVNSKTKNPSFNKRMNMEKEIIFGKDSNELLDYIEYLIGQMQPLYIVLKLFCLYCLCHKLTKKQYEFFENEIIQTYGCKKRFLFENMQKAGLFNMTYKPKVLDASELYYFEYEPRIIGLIKNEKPIEKTNFFTNLYKNIFSYAAEEEHKDEELVLKPIEASPVVTTVFKNFEESFDDFARFFDNDYKENPSKNMDECVKEENHINNKTLIYFIGGITKSEILAIRSLRVDNATGQSQDNYLIATTKIITGTTLIESLLPKIYDEKTNQMVIIR
jgi:hypothetical protein